MPRLLRCVAFLSLLLCAAPISPVFAQTPFKHQGLDLLHPPDSALPNEQVDPASGALTVVATDLVLPGNAGFNLAVQRVYNSGVYPDYDSGGSIAYEEDSWAGIGWTLHFGRILHSDSNSAGVMQVEMGDGSRHPLYHSLNNPNIWTTSDFWIYNPATHVLQLPNGRTYTFDREVFLNARLGTVRYVTEIRDPFQNRVTFGYFDASGPPDGVAQIHQILSATQTRDITFTYDATVKGLASMTYLNHTWTYDQAANGSDGFSVLYRVRPPQGAPTLYEYNFGELTAILPPFGGRIAYTYADAVRRAGALSTTTRVVTARTMSGHDVPTGTWTFAYSTGSNQDTTVVTCPCGGTTKYRFNGTGVSGDFTGWRAGTLADITVLDGTVTLEQRTTTWKRSERISNDPAPGVNGVWSDDAVYRPLLETQTTARGSHSWTTTYGYHEGQGNLNDFGQPYLIEAGGETIYQWRRTTRTFQYGFGPYLTGRVASETIQENRAFGESNGTTGSSWSYDPSTGFLTAQTIRGFTTTFEPRADGNVSAVVDGRGNRTTLGYDWGTVSAVHTPKVDTTYVVTPEGQVGSTTQGALTTSYSYDLALRLHDVLPPASNPITYTPDDLHGAYVRVTRGSSVVEHDVDAFGREFRSFNSQGLTVGLMRDTCGRVFATSDPYTSIPLTSGTIVVYDPLGRVRQVTDSAGQTTTFAYDGASLTRTDANNHATIFEYMAFGDPDDKRLVAVTDPQAHTTRYRYDVTGALTSVLGPGAGIERTWTLDGRGLVASETQPESGTTTYTYDELGNVKTITNANAQTTTFTYDENNRLTLRDAPGSTDDLAITYDTTGRIATLTGGGTTTTLSYDVANRRVTRTDQTAAGTFSSTSTSDANDNLQTLAYPSGRVVTYHYDAENRLTSLDHTPPGAASSVFAHDFAYGQDGRIASYVTGAVTHRFTYEQNRPKRIWTTGGTDALDLTYGYDNVGNVASIADPRPNATQTFVPDPLDRLDTATGPWGTLRWTYDAAGNRLSETAGSTTTTYSYNVPTQRLASTSGGANETFTYDNVGQLTSDGVISQYTYTPMGKLTGATGSGVSAAYTYDATGERLSKTVNGQTTYSIRSLGGPTLSEYLSICGPLTWSRDLIYAGGQLLGAAKAIATRATVAMDAASVTPGEAAGNATVTARLTTPNGGALGCAVTAFYRTSAGTAGAGADFTLRTGSVLFAAGSANGATQTITVPIASDTLDEDNETFFVDLTGASGGDIGAAVRTTVTVTDDDATPSLTIGNVSIQEGNSGSANATFTVSLSAASGRVVTVAYATANGTATSGADYGAASGTLTIPAGTASATMVVPVFGDTAYEATENFAVQLSNPVNATLAVSQATGTIVNDDQDLPPRNTWGDMYTTRDGTADAILFNPSTRLWTIRDSATGALGTFGPFGDTATYGDIFVPADYNGDGRTDCAYYRPSSGAWNIAPGCVLANAYSTAWGGDVSDVPVPADYDGDGRADIAIYRRATSVWYIAYSSGGSATVEFGWTWTNVIPVPGDYDGDGRADLAYYATYNSSWWIQPSSAGGVWVTDGTLFNATVIATPGDYDGDGRTDTAYFYPPTGSWYIVLAASRIATDNGGVGQWISFGSAGMIPAAADYDGDGKTDIAAYDPATQLFWIRRSNGNADSIAMPGAGSVPVLKRPQ